MIRMCPAIVPALLGKCSQSFKWLITALTQPHYTEMHRKNFSSVDFFKYLNVTCSWMSLLILKMQGSKQIDPQALSILQYSKCSVCIDVICKLYVRNRCQVIYLEKNVDIEEYQRASFLLSKLQAQNLRYWVFPLGKLSMYL